MKRNVTIGIVIIILLVFSVFFIFLKQDSLEEDYCDIDLESSTISCSENLRILTGYINPNSLIVINETKCDWRYTEEGEQEFIDCELVYENKDLIEFDENGFTQTSIGLVNDSYYSIKTTYRAPIYSQDSNYILGSIEAPYNELVVIKNIKTGEYYKFYAETSGQYDLKVDNTYLYDYDKCLEGKEESVPMGSLCLPKGYHGWRCEQGLFPIDFCEAYISKVKDEKAPLERCYDFGGEITAYCLPYEECLEFSGTNKELSRICNYNKCLEETEESNCFDAYFME